jgi:three-Cys-motif partner protein
MKDRIMPKDNSDFFKQKKIWSEVKDELLRCYLVPYFTKMLSMGKPILYVDCFAGKGKFDDGKPGSPLIALQSLDTSIEKRKRDPSMAQVNMKFIELNHPQELEENIPTQHRYRCKVIGGKFEDNINALLRNAMLENIQSNVFLYLDPYGVKALNVKLFDSLPGAFNSAELLINLNSFGFIREACRVMKVSFREEEKVVLSDLEEYDRSFLDSIQELNDIAGGDYWRKLIDDYNNGNIDCYEAEKRFSLLYKERLSRKYTYVLDMPIRLRAGQHPKYRMIHATNHPDGCILMADNIAKRADHLVIDIQSGGQLSFWPQTADNETMSEDMPMEMVKDLLENTIEWTGLNVFLAKFYTTYGVVCELSRLSSGVKGSVLKTLDKSGYIEVKRYPAHTSNGRERQFWQESKRNKLLLRKRS